MGDNSITQVNSVGWGLLCGLTHSSSF